MQSLAARPSTMSLPVPAKIRSACGVPLIRSLAALPRTTFAVLVGQSANGAAGLTGSGYTGGPAA
jgi:hypothetical protein